MSDSSSIDSLKKEPRTTILSRVGSTLSGKSEEIVLPIQPRTLAQTSTTNERWTRGIVSLLVWALIPLLGLGAGFCLPEILPNDSVQYSLFECSRLKTSGMETYFQIDIRTPFDLSFQNARLMSIGWDVVVGQFGRLIHGWILYRYVITPGLNRVMETTPVPFLTYVDLKFQPTSLQVLWTLGRSFPRAMTARLVATITWFIFAIVYTLGFASIWNAATGYTNPTKRLYQMPDESYLHLEQVKALSFCWTHDDPRLPNVPKLVKSQPLDQLNNTAHMLTQAGNANFTTPVVTFMMERTMIEYMMVPRETSEYSNEFMDIYWYMMTQGQLYNYLDRQSWITVGYDALADGPPSAQNLSLLFPTEEEAPWELRNLTDYHRPPATYPQIQAWQFARTFPQNATPGSTQNTSWVPRYHTGLDNHPSYTMTPNTAYAANFLLNSSIDITPGVIPYNSTFTWNGTSTALAAPFAKFNSDCHQIFGLGGPCVCHQDTPIPYPLNDDHVLCVAEDGYVWGFSGLIVVIGLVLEVIWIFGCWIVWLDAHVCSNLSKIRRSGAGPIRTAFDLVDASKKNLGEDISTCSDDELRRALRSCGLVEYELQHGPTGTKVSLVRRDNPATLKVKRRRKQPEDDEITVTSSFEASSGLPR